LVELTQQKKVLIPWSKVSPADYPSYAFNPVLRTYYVEVIGEGRRIYFFAGRRELERLESLRRSAMQGAPP
jgi:hypothetical protein